MMAKFWYLVKYSLKKKFKSKSFIIINIIIFILLLLVFNIDSIISFFGGDFDKETKIYIIDETEKTFDLFEETFNNTKIILKEDSSNVSIIKSDKEKEEIEKEIIGTTDIIVELKNDEENYLSASIITENYIDALLYQNLIQAINTTKYTQALNESNIDVEELTRISNPVNIDRIILDETKKTEEENMNTVMGVLFPTFILPFFMLIVLLVQLIGGEINEEKTTRSMEVIISNVPASVHFYSKLISSNVFIIIQAILIFLYGAIGFLVRSILGSGINSDFTKEFADAFASLSDSGILDKLYYIIPITIVLMLLSFLAYSLIAGILASMTVNAEDFQQIQTPIMIICMISYYLAVMASMFEGSIFIRILSYVPLMSFLLSPALLLIGQIGIIDVLIAIILLIVLIAVLTKYGLKVYKIGILNYSTDKMWKRLFKAAKM